MAKKMKSINDILGTKPKNISNTPFQKKIRSFRSSTKWQKVRRIQLLKEPMCFDPFKDHKNYPPLQPATQVHHINGLETHFNLRLHYSNLASICTKCHSTVEQLVRKGEKTQHLFIK